METEVGQFKLDDVLSVITIMTAILLYDLIFLICLNFIAAWGQSYECCELLRRLLEPDFVYLILFF